MGRIEWCMWANQQSLACAAVMIICGAISTYYPKPVYGYYTIGIAFLVVFFEYPRGKRVKGTTPERAFQHYLAPVLTKLGFFGRNFYVRFAFFVIISIPCYFQMPTVICGAYLDITALVYLRAGIAGEQWVDPRSTTAPKPKGPQGPKESAPKEPAPKPAKNALPPPPTALPPKPNKPPPAPAPKPAAAVVVE